MKIINKYLRIFALFIVSVLTIIACSNSGSTSGGGSAAAPAITAFSIAGNQGVFSSGNNILVNVSSTTNITNQVAVFTATGSVTVNNIPQKSGSTPNDFTVPLTYVVTNGNQSTSYVVTVKRLVPSAKQLSELSVTVSGTTTSAIKSATANAFTIMLPYATSVTSLLTSYKTIPAGLNVTATANGVTTQQISGQTSNDFTKPVTFTVFADDGSSIDYTVTVDFLPNTANSITYYALVSDNGPLESSAVPATINGNNISITLPANTVTSLSSVKTNFLAPGIESIERASTSTGAGTPIESGEFLDYSTPFYINVTSVSGESRQYLVSASQTTESDAKNITSFGLSLPTPGAEITPAVIVGKTITAVMPANTIVNNLVINFTTAGGYLAESGTVLPALVSGVTTGDFTSPKVYNIVDGNGITESYEVIVQVASLTDNALTAFSLNGIPGRIFGNNIVVTVPYGTDTSQMVARFTTTGYNVSVAGSTQISGQSINDFSGGAVIYRVTSLAATTRDYYVLVRHGDLGASDLTSFSINGVQGVFTSESTLRVTLPYITGAPATDFQALVAEFTTNSESLEPVFISTNAQTSGVTINDFSSGSAIYTVYPASGSPKTYTVTITEAALNTATIESFVVNGVLGTIAGTAPNFTVSVVLPPSMLTSGNIPQFITTAARVTVSGAVQTSGVSVMSGSTATYVARAANGTTNNYAVTLTNATAVGNTPIAVVPYTSTTGNMFAYVMNFGNNTIFACRITAQGTLLSSCVNATATLLNGPGGMAFSNVGGNGYVYIANITGNSITACNVNQSTGLFTLCSNTGVLPGASSLRGMAVDPTSGGTRIVAVSFGNNSVEVCSLVAGTVVAGCVLSATSGLNQPTAVSFNNVGDFVYITNGNAAAAPSVCSYAAGIVSGCTSSGATAAGSVGLGFSADMSTVLIANNNSTITGCNNGGGGSSPFNNCINNSNTLFGAVRSPIYSPANQLMSIITVQTTNNILACPLNSNGRGIPTGSCQITGTTGAGVTWQ